MKRPAPSVDAHRARRRICSRRTTPRCPRTLPQCLDHGISGCCGARTCAAGRPRRHAGKHFAAVHSRQELRARRPAVCAPALGGIPVLGNLAASSRRCGTRRTRSSGRSLRLLAVAHPARQDHHHDVALGNDRDHRHLDQRRHGLGLALRGWCARSSRDPTARSGCAGCIRASGIPAPCPCARPRRRCARSRTPAACCAPASGRRSSAWPAGRRRHQWRSMPGVPAAEVEARAPEPARRQDESEDDGSDHGPPSVSRIITRPRAEHDVAGSATGGGAATGTTPSRSPRQLAVVPPGGGRRRSPHPPQSAGLSSGNSSSGSCFRL